MISVTRLNNEGFVINGELIEKLEAKPDTTITLLNGHVYIVKEKVEEVIKKVIEYKKSIFIGPQKE
ncbi:MAG TPA: flagellar FlbD family protein [Petrotogaceae bacterium]|jgi:flagellar protein FlbD|nr:flagellar FlbD family protein [Petrotogaceae bacterium]HOG33577.1 flagellar FlbD family protein [Petrotogaceae bacterium]HPG47752.1 flagellar FlbD family protein [Petrotogaceae bacterium]HPO26020.1 flagellar FlbD family protein [Petrotogaceae bacterium]